MVDAVELLATGDTQSLAKIFAQFPQFTEVKTIRADRVEAETKKGVATVLHLAPRADFAAAMVRTTGSAEHLRDLETEAEARGLSFKKFKLGNFKSNERTRKGKRRSKQSHA